MLNLSSAYLHLHFYDEAEKCLSYAIELAPYAADAYIRRSQAIMYNFESNMMDFKQAINDCSEALKRKPNDKFYKAHKEELDGII